MFDTLRNNSKIIVYIVVIAFVVTGAFMGYGAYLNRSSSSPTADNSGSSPYIASVNGSKINTQEFYQVLQNQVAQNPQLDNSQATSVKLNVLKSMIERRLILQKAQEMGIKSQVTDGDIENTVNNILESNDMERDEFIANLEKQNYTFNQLKEDIRTSLEQNDIIQKTIDKVRADIEVTEAEIKEQYKEENDGKEPAGEDYEEAKADIKQKLMNQKQNEAFNNWIEKIKVEADITINDPVLSGVYALQNKNYEKAIEKLNNVLEDGSSPQIYNYLASAYSSNGQTEKTLEVYEKAIEDYPENGDLLVSLGQLYQEMGKDDEAIKTFEKASDVAERDFSTHYQLFIAFNKLGATEQAQKEMQIINDIQQQQASPEQQVEPEELRDSLEGDEQIDKEAIEESTGDDEQLNSGQTSETD